MKNGVVVEVPDFDKWADYEKSRLEQMRLIDKMSENNPILDDMPVEIRTYDHIVAYIILGFFVLGALFLSYEIKIQPHENGLYAISDPLQAGEKCENASDNKQIPIVRRLLVCICGFLIGTPLILYGFYNIYNERFLLGSGLTLIGIFCGCSGMALLVAIACTNTWGWWL